MSGATPQWVDGDAPRAPVFTGTERFALRRTLGEGGMGVVYEAWDHERGMAVALKTLRLLDAQNLFRLKSEFRAHADIEHRNLVRLGELMHEAGFWFFTMELVDGQGLREWIANDPNADVIDTSTEIAIGGAPPQARPYDERRLRSALRQLASGLDALHRAGKVHRDLKPSNVMVTHKDRLVILDLGLAADLAPRDASDKNAVGTAAYVAPEQAMSAAASPSSDWYSVGVMLFEALTGTLPVDGSPLEILLKKQNQAPNAALLADAPPDLAALCLDLLAIDPAQRPDGNAILARVAAPRAITGEGSIAPPTTSSPFVGRASELEALSHALSDVDGGGAVTVRIEGASGIGKSALVRHFLEHVVRQRPGALVLSGRCHERETVPYKGLDGVVDAIARALIRLELGDSALPPAAETAALAQVFPVLLRVPAITRVSATLPENPFELRARAFRGLRLLLRKLASRRIVVLTIDDVQWADADSLALLREILHAPGAPRLLMVLTWRGESPPTLPGPVRVIELARLTQAEAEGLVALVAPERVADAAALAAAADGHPMFLRELLRHAAPPRKVRLDDALWARIARMDTSARRILELVSVAGRPLPQNLVIDALGLDPRTSAKWLGVLRAASLVRTGGARGSDPVEPYHDRVRAAVVARVAPARRRRYHARLAAALTASGLVDKDPLAVVKHLESAGLTAQAGDLARRAARQSSTRAPAFEQIAALCDAALRLGADQGDRDIRRGLLVERAEALACRRRARG
jgi:tRNA A-37 threonylcarbamoyl transferase component Bud32